MATRDSSMSDLSQTPNATTVVTAVVILRVGEGKAARIAGKTVLPAPVLLQLLQMTVMRRASSPCFSSERMTLTCSTATPTSAVDSDVCIVSLYNSCTIASSLSVYTNEESTD